MMGLTGVFDQKIKRIIKGNRCVSNVKIRKYLENFKINSRLLKFNKKRKKNLMNCMYIFVDIFLNKIVRF